MKLQIPRCYCANCEAHVIPTRHELPWRFIEGVAWAVTLGIFLFIGVLVPVALVMVALPMLAVASMIGPLHELANAGPHCPLCHRMLPERRLAEALREPALMPGHPLRA
jgi:hypothetical protein